MFLSINVLQGVSQWNVFSKLSLTDRNMQTRICLKVDLKSWDWGVWVSSTSILKSNIFWPQQARTERVSDIGEKLDFWLFISQKGTSIVLVLLVPEMVKSSGPGSSLSELVEVAEAVDVAEADEVNEAAEVSKA